MQIVGTCGFGRVKRPEYVQLFPVVEIQHTFYHPPEIKTLEKWRRELPDDFECTLKAWQMITHESIEPDIQTPRPPDDRKRDRGGWLLQTDRHRQEALELTLECARALRARTILFQCPAKFQPLPENILNMKHFFSSFDRTGLNLALGATRQALGSRGDQRDLRRARPMGLRQPVPAPDTTPDRCYYRLHGQPRWRYTYEDEELYELATLLPRTASRTSSSTTSP